jgi:hypothetical protein
VAQDTPPLSGSQKRSPAYVVFVEPGLDSELANVLAQTPILCRTRDYMIFKKRWRLRETSIVNEQITLLFFGYMRASMYVELHSVSHQ